MIPSRIRWLAALAAFAATAAAALPTEIVCEYKVVHTGFTIGRISETFVRNGEGYSAVSVTRSDGPLKVLLDDQITLESTGRVTAAGLQPLVFTQVRAKDHVRDLKTTFDWDKAILRTAMRGETSETPLPEGTQDRLSVMYQFVYLPALGETLTIPMVMNRRIEPYTYRLVEAVKLTTAAGEFDTLHYQRTNTKPDDTKVDVWLARSHANFPVRAVFDDPKGFRLEQVVEKLQVRQP
jgi:hypothetical protein